MPPFMRSLNRSILSVLLCWAEAPSFALADSPEPRPASAPAAQSQPSSAPARSPAELQAKVAEWFRQVQAAKGLQQRIVTRDAMYLPEEVLPDIEALLNRPGLTPAEKVCVKQGLYLVKRSLRDKKLAQETENGEWGWIRETVSNAYRQVNQQEPKWNEQVNPILSRAPYALAYRPTPNRRACWVFDLQTLENLAGKGCNDPLILFLYGKYNENIWAGTGLIPSEKLYRDCAARTGLGMEKSEYHPYWRMEALLFSARIQGKNFKDEDLKTRLNIRQRWIRKAYELLPQTLADLKIPRWALAETLTSLLRYRAESETNWPETLEEGLQAVKMARPDDPSLPDLIRGKILLNCYTIKNNSGTDPFPQGDNKPAQEQFLAQAYEALVRAHRLNPHDPVPPTELLLVARYKRLPQDEMEQWYKIALENEPINARAIQYKFQYLSPVRCGTNEKMLAYWQEVIDQESLQHIDLLFHLLGWFRFQSSLQVDKFFDDSFYQTLPQAWDNIQLTLVPHIKAHPGDWLAMSEYVCWAGLYHQWIAAEDMMKRLEKFGGAHFDPWYTPQIMIPWLQRIKKEAAQARTATQPAVTPVSR